MTGLGWQMTAGHVTWSFTAFCQLVTPPGVGSCRVALQEEHRSRCALEGLTLITQVGAVLPPNLTNVYTALCQLQTASRDGQDGKAGTLEDTDHTLANTDATNKLTSYCGTGHTTLEEGQAGVTHWTHTGST